MSILSSSSLNAYTIASKGLVKRIWILFVGVVAIMANLQCLLLADMPRPLHVWILIGMLDLVCESGGYDGQILQG